MKFRPSTPTDYPAIADLLRVAGSRHAASAAELSALVRGIREHPAGPHFLRKWPRTPGRWSAC
ncbi:hypothetical protein ACFP81_10065 [Deinococcus lacus]|uniref:Uncharacterized protein n=1 Tax=Deinococcus lacus TaxID=392561 RepID=A0ABW1YD92_9DEIO